MNFLFGISKRQYVSPATIAFVYAGLGDKDREVHWLDRAAAVHDSWLEFTKVDPIFDPLRGDERFQDLLK